MMRAVDPDGSLILDGTLILPAYPRTWIVAKSTDAGLTWIYQEEPTEWKPLPSQAELVITRQELDVPELDLD